MVDREALLEAIRLAVSDAGGNRISRNQFLASSGFKLSDVFRHFPSWSDTLAAAGFSFDRYNERIAPEELLTDWGLMVRKSRSIPTRNQYKIDGTFSASVFERNFGPWSSIPAKFCEYAAEMPEWADVVAMLPAPNVVAQQTAAPPPTIQGNSQVKQYSKLSDRPTYGDPIDFRGLRHAPINEDGVIFLFGMVARELGYLVESVQGGFPDCEAKRQIAPGKWQRVRIEFEFESRNFRDHGHPIDGCDIVVCWKHNWADCPSTLDVVELQTEVSHLADSVD